MKNITIDNKMLYAIRAIAEMIKKAEDDAIYLHANCAPFDDSRLYSLCKTLSKCAYNQGLMDKEYKI